MDKNIIFKDIEDKTVVWFASSNQYAVLEKRAAQIIEELDKNIPLSTISHNLAADFDISEQEATHFIKEIEKNILQANQQKSISSESESGTIEVPTEYMYSKWYSIDEVIFKIEYTSEFELYLVHPKFAHLEVVGEETNDHHFQVFTYEGLTFLYVNGAFIGSWAYPEIHYFQGKLSMEIIQLLHQKPEKDWLGVFHASAVSDGKSGMLFLGDSGNGKSTSLALLQAHGFHCIADDFVPVSAFTQNIFSFPAAISIKKNSLDVLTPYYPELRTTAEYHFKRLNKVVRFLPPKNEKSIATVPCKGFVFIKYSAAVDFDMKPISSLQAFEKLIPDSWLSPIEENVSSFLSWFSTIPCYQITYSDNDRMISEVSKLFANVL